jgi:hypothetical protein
VETAFNVIVLIGSVCGFLSFIVLLLVAVYLVKLRDDTREFLGELLDVMDATEPSVVVHPPSKTWDEKYEDTLAELDALRRGDTGLVDLDPTQDYSTPPPPNGDPGLTTHE